MRISFKELYKNVKRGKKELKELDKLYIYDRFSEAYSRITIESLLLDDETPMELYESLVGFTKEDIELYRYYFFNLPKGTPQLSKYQLYYTIDSYFKDESKELNNFRKDLYYNVLWSGWQYIDQLFNRGKMFDFDSSYLPVFAVTFSYLTRKLHNAIAQDDFATVKEVMKVMNQARKNYSKKEEEKTEAEQLVFKFKELADDIEEDLPGVKIDTEFKKLIPQETTSNKKVDKE